jgi:phosphoribosyl 1,2-cyclic phosphate phosphodiesterase
MGSLLFLGTGASFGTPVIGCNCATCSSTDPKNKRLRTSAFLQIQNKNFLLDVGPDFRAQALRHEIKQLDGLLITHPHYDHIGGLEELRIFNFLQKEPVSCLLSKESFLAVKKLYYYHFEPQDKGSNVTAQFAFQEFKHDRESVDFCGVKMQTFSYTHSGAKVSGYRFGTLAYVTDIKEYPETIFEDLQGVETLLLGALRFGRCNFQFSIDEAVDFAKKVGAKMTYFMHMAHEVEYFHLSSLLPEHIQPAYDGFQLHFEDFR